VSEQTPRRRQRGNGEGSISQRADGRWWARMSLGWKGGRRRVKALYGTTRADVAQQLLSELRNAGQASEPDQVPTLAGFAEQWLVDVARDLKPSSVKFYADNLKNHLLPAFGARPLPDVHRRDVLNVIATMKRKGLKLNTVKGATRTLSTLMAAAIDKEYVRTNPVASLRKHLRRGLEAKPEPDPLSVDDARLLVEAARQQGARWFAFVLCALRTGMRLSELLGLEWRDIDWRGQTIRIERALVKGTLGTPKSHQSRTVDLSPQLALALRWHRREQRALFLGYGLPLPAAVFVNRDGGRQDESKVRKVLAALCGKAEIRPRTPHALRDTYASQLLSQNVPLLYVSAQLGHSDPSVTLKHYGRYLPKPETRYAALLDTRSA
jgi:integrase